MNAHVDSDLPRYVRGLGLLAAAGASLGLALWSWWIGPNAITAYALANDVAPQTRWQAIGAMGGVAALAAGIGFVLAARHRDRPRAEVFEACGRRAAPLIVVGLLPYLFNWSLWSGHELTMLLLITLFGLSLQSLARMSFATPPVLSERPAPALARAGESLARVPWLPTLLVVLGIAGYAAYFSYHTLQTHYRLGTAAFDLGLEDNLLWNAAHGGRLFKTSPLGGPDSVHTGIHQTWFAFALVPLYALFQDARTLLVLQSTLFALAALPLYWLARSKLGAWTGCALAYAYLLYPPLHGANLYEFHYAPLATLFLLALLHCVEQRRDVLATIATVLALSVREDIGVLVAVLGLYLCVTGIRPRAGLLLALVGAAYFSVLKLVVMPHYLAGAEAFVDQYKLLLGPGEKGVLGLLKTVGANPYYTSITLTERDKLVYTLQIFAPLAFLPLRRPIALLCCVPGFFFTLLGTAYPPLVQISFQYSAYWTPFLFIAVIAALDWFRRRELAGAIGPESRRAWLLALGAAMLVSSFQFGAVLDRHNARGGYSPYRFGLEARDRVRHEDAYALIARVPPQAPIVASEFVVPQVSNRRDAYTLRIGAFDADYLLFERELFDTERQQAVKLLRSGKFGVVEVRGDFALAQRGWTTERNADVIASLAK